MIRWLQNAALYAGLALALPASAALELQGTRVIFNADDQRASLIVRNPTASPLLVQTWMDAGDPTVAPSEVATPFAITPPLFRLEPEDSRGLLILPAGAEALPRDRESLYYVNVLDVPPAAKERDFSFQLTTRARLKLFYRPSGLAGGSTEAAAGLQWQWVGQGAQRELQVRNASAFHVSITGIRVGGTAWVDQADIVVAPRATQNIGSSASVTGDALHFTWMDDYGTPREASAQIGH